MLRRPFVAVVLAFAAHASVASAQPGAPASAPPSAPASPAPPALPAPSASSSALAPLPAPVYVTPAPGQAAASAPSPRATPITATCSLGDHPGIDDDEARTGADILCHELARQGATNTQHEIRFGRLGGKTLVTIASRSGNTYDERRTMLTGMDELPVASPRMASALATGKEMEETRTVDNVLSSETRAAKVQRGQMGFEGGFFGTTGLGVSAGSSGGVALGLLYRAGNWGLSGSGRAGGIGSSDEKLGSASVDVGARYYLTNGETAPFAGGGLGLSYFNLSRSSRADMDGSGFEAYAMVGIETFRTHHTALSLSLRADVPFYALKSGSEDSYRYDYTTGTSVTVPRSEAYLVPISLNVAMLFH